MRATKIFRDFFSSEKAGGIILLIATLVSLIIANSGVGNGYMGFWHKKTGGLTIEHWINDGLMAVFFLLIGLELVREKVTGELKSVKDAMLPIFAAIGGILLPAGLYLIFNAGTPYSSGAGIPMATDIAFALGVLSLLGNRAPLSLKIFLTALAVIDDLGAILIIAIFYTKTIVWLNLLIALAIFAVLIGLNKRKVKNLIPYIMGGLAMWYFMFTSGVHATIAGVLLAFVIPFGDGSENSPSYKVQHFLHKPVAFFILPLFALANTAILLSGSIADTLSPSYNIGIAAGLIVGKPLGVMLLSGIAVKLGLCKLPEDVNWKAIAGAGLLSGIGFTMSIFITLLAFDNAEIINNAKLMILLSSLVAGVAGYLTLQLTLRKTSLVDRNGKFFNIN